MAVGLPLKSLFDRVLGELGRFWQDHVTVNETLLRPSDVYLTVGNPSLARPVLDWSASIQMPELAVRPIRATQHGAVD